MNKLLASTAIVGAMLIGMPAFADPDVSVNVLAGTFETDDSTDIVLNGQLNLDSPTSATGVDVIVHDMSFESKANVDIKNIDVTAVGNLNETVANGGGSTFELTALEVTSSTKTKSGSDWNLSVESIDYSAGNTSVAVHDLSASGSAWNNTKSKSGTHSFGISKTERNSVFVGSIQANVGSPTTAIGVSLDVTDSSFDRKVDVGVKNVTVTAVGNMNSTKLK